jgi:hypothetical protein
MDLGAIFGFAIIVSLLVLGLFGMFVLGRPRRRKRGAPGVGHGGDGGAWVNGGEGGSGADFIGHSGGHSDGGGHGGH